MLRPDQLMSCNLLAAAYGHLGLPEEARPALEVMERLSPKRYMERLHAIVPPALVERYLDGWRKAGWKGDEQG